MDRYIGSQNSMAVNEYSKISVEVRIEIGQKVG
jgi:hypothetical protein